ncbi:LIVCS family branched-chain amino acid:cation transporter [Salsuginibacillus halophilus]|uniref:Branched-chain amino acid transport system carrier protein n=1 Tax=Salsuginibacillus halophilus TaxID=517424 RepID=A0A2P8HLC5_9BACI|nr:branched-chain amino acid transport system II carrier protein [Salsuginibacillus halophilus]PSL47018.1 LIVCS family branched-chain amino acid:cation transporter [Salsuginibacillus halophilus]
MNHVSNKDTFFIGLMLFALFFGAGNLIFPPFLGQEAGSNYGLAIIGFVVTGVGLPVLAIIAIAMTGKGFENIAKRVNLPFAIAFTMVLYLAIGPFFGIPRAMNVAYEIGAMPFLPETNEWVYLLTYSFVFFAIVYWLSLNPSKLVKRVGYILTPALLLAIFFMFIGTLGQGEQSSTLSPSEEYAAHPFFRGVIEGYLTMDTIAALAFGLVIIMMIRDRGVMDQRLIARTAGKAGIVAGISLAVVYMAIGWFGVKSGPIATFENGGEILTFTAEQGYGLFGVIILAMIVTLACLTTCVGLVTACGEYFERTVPKASYKSVALIVTSVSLVIANAGLNAIIAFSVPVLVAIYPISIVLIALTFIHAVKPLYKGHYAGVVIGTSIISLHDGLAAAELVPAVYTELVHVLPFAAVDFAWVVPAILGGVIGHFISRQPADCKEEV